MRNLRYVSDFSDFHQVFSATLGKMATVQGRFADIVGNRDWNVDFERCEIAFGDQIYKIRFIGSESNVSDTWLWGHANVNNFGEEATRFSAEVLSAGLEWGLQAFSEPSFELDETFNGHTLSIAACGAVGENLCYYGCRHDNGCAFMAITDAPTSLLSLLARTSLLKSQAAAYKITTSIIKFSSKAFWNLTESNLMKRSKKADFLRKPKTRS